MENLGNFSKKGIKISIKTKKITKNAKLAVVSVSSHQKIAKKWGIFLLFLKNLREKGENWYQGRCFLLKINVLGRKNEILMPIF